MQHNADLELLRRRLRYLLQLEEYERCARIRDWIKEITENANKNIRSVCDGRS